MARPGGLRPRLLAIAGSIVAVGALAIGLAAARSPIEPRADAAVITSKVADAPTTTTTEAPTTTTTSEPPAEPGLPPPHPGPPIFPSTIALARVPSVAVYDQPAGRLVRSIPSPKPPINGIASFRVIDGSTPGWLLVQLPTRPNGSTGWIKASDVMTGRTDISIDVDIAAKWITVYRGSSVVAERLIADGAAVTPTPVGEFYVSEVVPGGGGAYGPWAYGLSAHSDVLTEFAGGDGQVALHGTNAPWLLGTSASAGCVRMPNDLSQFLHDARVVPGTPVRIHRG